jgi:hypothetical protein
MEMEIQRCTTGKLHDFITSRMLGFFPIAPLLQRYMHWVYEVWI